MLVVFRILKMLAAKVKRPDIVNFIQQRKSEILIPYFENHQKEILYIVIGSRMTITALKPSRWNMRDQVLHNFEYEVLFHY